MKNYIISHDTAQVTQEFLDVIRSYPKRWGCAKDVRIVKSNKSAKQIFNELSPFLTDGDKLVVVEISKPLFRSDFKGDCEDWLDIKL